MALLPRYSFFKSLFCSVFHPAASPQFLTSSSSTLVNPRHSAVSSDNISQSFSSHELAGLSDEVILAALSRGFFGGFVFGLERIALKLGGGRIFPAHFTGLSVDENLRHVWSRGAISGSRLHPVGTRFFGTFQVIDSNITTSETTKSFSYIDYGFGSDLKTFDGCHRIGVTRFGTGPNDGTASSLTGEKINISLEGFICNPSENGTLRMGPLLWFHRAYARLLLANSIQELLIIAKKHRKIDKLL